MRTAVLYGAIENSTMDQADGTQERPMQKHTENPPSPAFHGSVPAALVIGPYLVLQLSTLGLLAALSAVAPNGEWLSQWLPASLAGLMTILGKIPTEQFADFQRHVLAFCFAGMGGAVFMIREFYLNFAYGHKRLGQPRRFLQASEIPRYILLPVSSCILGPVGVALLQAGAIVFSGLSAEQDIPSFTLIAVSFVLGFSYHDTLNGLRGISRKIWEPTKSRNAAPARKKAKEEEEDEA